MVIHADKLRWLFWLRWKMLIRSFTRSNNRVHRIVGTFFLLLFGFPVVGGIAVGTYFAYRLLPSPANTEALFLVLTGMYVLWAILPIFEFTTNEGLDLSKLALFPLTRAELMVSLLISTLLDIPTLGLFLVMGAVVVAWSSSIPLTIVALLAMVILYTAIIGTSQLVLALLMRILQSRRFRDLSIFLLVLLSSSGYLCQFVFRGAASENMFNSLQSARFSPYLQWFPPGMAARAIQQAYMGHWQASVLWLLTLIAASLLALYLWLLVVERALSNPESGAPLRTSRRGAENLAANTPASIPATSLWSHLLPPQVWALTLKDLKYYRRDPQLQAMLLQSIVSIVFLVAITVVNTGNAGHRLSFLGSWSVLFAPAFVFLSLYTLSYNVLGFERQSLTTLFLFPVDPRRILWSKNIVVFVLGMGEMLLLVLLTSAFSRSWHLVLPSLTIGVAGVAVVVGCGNFTSVFFPQRMRQAQRGFQSSANLSAEGGCLRAVTSMLAFAAMIVILLPVVMALALPMFFHLEWIWTFSIPASLFYGLAFYYVVTSLVAARLLDRIPEIIEAIVRE